MTLVAQWNAIPSTLTIDPNGGSYSGSTSITNGYGSTYSISSPSRTGYSLGAWVLDGGGTISTFGKLHDSFTDPFFMDGTNSTYVYNNASNGTVTHQYIASSNVDIELPSGARILRITNTGSASPGLGGFTNHLGTRANAVFYTIIYAKIPVGYSISSAENAYGGGTKTWLTSQAGTGDWQVYIHRYNCGSSGSFSSVNYYYLSGTAGTTSNPVVWDVAYFGTYDATGLSTSGSSTTTLTYTYDDSNNSLVALWNINSYTLTVNPNGGTWSGSTSNQTFTQKYLTTKEIAEPTRTGYIFNGWSLSGYGSFSGTTFTYGAGNATLRANWIETWAVNYTIPSGSGTEEDPYQVDSASDLAYFAYKTQILGEQCYDHIVLTKDIDLAGYDWMPIGTGRNVVSGVQPYFRGTFDGQGHSISNLNINTIGKTTYAEYGLFGLVDVDAKLKNFTILSGQVNGLGERTGGVVGYVWSATIEKVTNYASVSGTNYVGGIVGQYHSWQDDFIQNCANYGDISGNNCIGGIVGGSDDSSGQQNIHNSVNLGNISGNIIVGGIVGYMRDANIQGCVNIGDIVSFGNHSGGIVGDINSGIISNCQVEGNISGQTHHGGLVGKVEDTGSIEILNCGVNATVSATNNANANGILGQGSAVITNSYFIGDFVNKSGNAMTMDNYIGYIPSGGTSQINDSYFISMMAIQYKKNFITLQASVVMMNCLMHG